MSDKQTPVSGPEFLSEMSDLAVGLGILTFTLGPFALPVLALAALAAVPILIAVLLGGMLVTPLLVARRLVAVTRSRIGRYEAHPVRRWTPRRRSAAPLERSAVIFPIERLTTATRKISDR